MGGDVKDEDKHINIDNFTELIDEKFWEEFMPKGVSKQVFENFKNIMNLMFLEEQVKNAFVLWLVQLIIQLLKNA